VAEVGDVGFRTDGRLDGFREVECLCFGKGDEMGFLGWSFGVREEGETWV
jgi:hypothetical protein